MEVGEPRSFLTVERLVAERDKVRRRAELEHELLVQLQQHDDVSGRGTAKIRAGKKKSAFQKLQQETRIIAGKSFIYGPPNPGNPSIKTCASTKLRKSLVLGEAKNHRSSFCLSFSLSVFLSLSIFPPRVGTGTVGGDGR